MRLPDLFYVEELVPEEPHAPAGGPSGRPAGPVRFKLPVLSVILENTETGSTKSWGQDGVDVRGIKQSFSANASTGGTILEGMRFVGSFSARIIEQKDGVLRLKFTKLDAALRKRLSAGGTRRAG